MPLYATSETDFFAQEINADVSFVKNPEGDVTALLLRQHDAQDTHEHEAKRTA